MPSTRIESFRFSMRSSFAAGDKIEEIPDTSVTKVVMSVEACKETCQDERHGPLF